MKRSAGVAFAISIVLSTGVQAQVPCGTLMRGFDAGDVTLVTKPDGTQVLRVPLTRNLPPDQRFSSLKVSYTLKSDLGYPGFYGDIEVPCAGQPDDPPACTAAAFTLDLRVVPLCSTDYPRGPNGEMGCAQEAPFKQMVVLSVGYFVPSGSGMIDSVSALLVRPKQA